MTTEELKGIQLRYFHHREEFGNNPDMEALITEMARLWAENKRWVPKNAIGGDDTCFGSHIQEAIRILRKE